MSAYVCRFGLQAGIRHGTPQSHDEPFQNSCGLPMSYWSVGDFLSNLLHVKAYHPPNQRGSTN